jgi:hypothetical protein
MLVCTLVVVGACGRKGPPRPPKASGLPAVQDLRAAVEGGSVRLTWTQPAGSKGVAGFIIERSGPAKDRCPECPRSYGEVRKLAADTEAAEFEAVDESLPGTGGFFYRVIPYDARGQKGAESNEALVTVE